MAKTAGSFSAVVKVAVGLVVDWAAILAGVVVKVAAVWVAVGMPEADS